MAALSLSLQWQLSPRASTPRARAVQPHSRRPRAPPRGPSVGEAVHWARSPWVDSRLGSDSDSAPGQRDMSRSPIGTTSRMPRTIWMTRRGSIGWWVCDWAGESGFQEVAASGGPFCYGQALWVKNQNGLIVFLLKPIGNTRCYQVLFIFLLKQF